MRMALALSLVTLVCTGCQAIYGPNCDGPFELILVDFSGTVVRNGVVYPNVQLSGGISEIGAAFAFPGAREQWTLSKDVLLGGKQTPGRIDVSVSGNLLPGPQQQLASLSLSLLSPYAVGDTLVVERWPSTACHQDPRLACVSIADSAVPHPLWVNGTVRMVGRKPAVWALDLVSDPDTRARYAVAGTIRFRHGTSPRVCYSD